MAKRIGINIVVNENGTVTAKRVGDAFTTAARQIERNTRESFTRMNTSVSGQLDQMTARMVRWGTLAASVFGGLALRSIGQLGAEFEKRMSAVGAFANATGAEFEQLRKQAIALGESTVFTATNSAEAMEQLGLAGFKTTEILKVMPDVLSLAAAGSLEMGAAAEIASNVMRQMGLDASGFKKAVDTIAFAASESTTNVQELGVAFSYAGNLARTVGLSVEDVAAAFGVLANQGVAGERAGTGLARVLSVMLGNLEEGEKGLGKFNLKLFDQQGRFVGLSEAMRQMQEAGVGVHDVMEAFGERGGRTMLAFLNAGSKGLDEFTAKTKNAGGFAEQMAQKLRDNVSGDVEQLTGVLQSLALTIFDQATPAIRGLVQNATELARTWGEMLRGSDVIGGLERAAKLLAATLSVLLVNAAKNAAISLGTLTLNILAAASGATALDMALLRTIPVMDAVALASKRMWIAIGGIALVVGTLAYQATRAVLEITGLDSAIESFLSKSRGGDGPDVLRRFSENLELIDRTVSKLGSKGIDLGIDFGALDETRKTVQQLQKDVANRVKLNFSTADIQPFVDALDAATRQSRELLRLSNEFGPRFNVAWETAGRGAKTLEERIERVKALLAAPINKLGVVKPPPVDDAAKKAIEAATKQLEQSLLRIGVVTKESVAKIEKEFALIGQVASAQKVPLDELAEAFREDLIRVGDAAERSGVKLDAFLKDLVTRAKSLPPLDFTLNVDVVSADDRKKWEDAQKVQLERAKEIQAQLQQIRLDSVQQGSAAEAAILNEQARAQLDADFELFQENQAAKIEALDLFYATVEANERRHSEAMQQIAQAEYQARIAGIQQVLAAAGQLIASAFTDNKWAAYAGAIINTALAVTQAMSSGTFPYNLIAAAIVGAAGAVQITKIKSTNIPSGGTYAAEGAIINRGPAHMIAGERGAEAIVPLTGAPARRAARAMGIGEGTGGGVSITVQNYGPNWNQRGVNEDLVEKIWQGIQRGIRVGRLRPLDLRTA